MTIRKKERTRRFIKRLKVFETVIESRDYDFPGFGAELDRYLLQNDVAPAVKHRIRLAIEELVQQILLPELDEPFIRVSVEYSGEGGCSIFVAYRGNGFDIRDTDNDLSLSILDNTAEELTYGYEGEEEEMNTVKIQIKKD